ncbi:hypothetical protein Tco_0782889 [Tanacetum coccineum]
MFILRMTDSRKFDDSNLVSLRNSFAALNEHDKVFEIVENSKAVNVKSKPGEKLIEDSESDMAVTYDEFTLFMASKGTKASSGIGNKSLYEQWKKIMFDNEYDPYDDEYNAHDLTNIKWPSVTLLTSSFVVDEKSSL